MHLDLRQAADNEQSRFNQLAASVAEPDVLQSWEWGELKGAFGWVPHRLFIEREGVALGTASLLERRLPLGKSLFYCSRGPALDYTDTSAVAAALAALADYAGAHNGFVLKIDPPLEVNSAGDVSSVLEAGGFQRVADETGFGGTQPRCVMKLALDRDPEALLASFKSKTRYNIRLSARKGIVVRDDCDLDQLPHFYRLLQITTARDRFVVRSADYFEQMMRLLRPAGQVRLFMAYYHDEPVAGALATRFGNCCTYLYGASANRHRNRMPSYGLQWSMIQWAQREGCDVYDFRGVSPNPESDSHLGGLNRFKLGFNARFVEYLGEYDRVLSRPHYFAWNVARPAAVKLLKRLRRQGGGDRPAASNGNG